MYRIVPTNRYEKSLKRISQHKDFNIERFKEIILLLKSDEHIEPQYRDHELKGEFAGIRECHIQNDILLMYRKEKEVLILILVDIGTHSSLFQ